MSVTPLRRGPDVHELFGQLRALIEEVRLEMHDKLAQQPQKKEASGDEVQGIISAASLIETRIQHSESQMLAALEPITEALKRDATYDQQVAQRLEKVDASLNALTQEMQVSRETMKTFTACLDEFTKTMRTPLTRSGVVETPHGPVKMTVTEKRGK
jgi:small-conductance mechanosensitive channel